MGYLDVVAGDTALTLAVRFADARAALLLIERGADVAARNSRGESALDLCLHDEADRDELAAVIEALTARGAVRRPGADASASRAAAAAAADGGSESEGSSGGSGGSDDSSSDGWHDSDDDVPDERAD
jgi:ankyrin repeat protein